MKEYYKSNITQSRVMVKQSDIRGFTMVELMITLAIASIVLAVAVPSMQSMTSNSKAERVTGLFKQDLKFARSHAITQGEEISIQKTTDGWKIFAESDVSNIIRERKVLDSAVTINGLSKVSFTATGQISSTNFSNSVDTETITIRTEHCTRNNDKSFELLRSGQIAETELACIQ